MTLCPVAIVAGCRKCPVFAVGPLKGDNKKEEFSPTRAAPKTARSNKKPRK